MEGQNVTTTGDKCLTKCRRHFIGGRTNPGSYIDLKPVLSFRGRTGAADLATIHVQLQKLSIFLTIHECSIILFGT